MNLFIYVADFETRVFDINLDDLMHQSSLDNLYSTVKAAVAADLVRMCRLSTFGAGAEGRASQEIVGSARAGAGVRMTALWVGHVLALSNESQ